MFKYLFFDDQRLFVRENLDRRYGEPELLEVYQDPWLDTSISGVHVFKCSDGRYHMIFHGIADDPDYINIENIACSTGLADVRRHAFVAAAVSDDGVHFIPRLTGNESCSGNPPFPHSVSGKDWDMGELGCVVEDPDAPEDERYKALMVTAFKESECRHCDYLMASGDLIHWHNIPEGVWHKVGTEPIVSCFRNKVYGNFTIICRPDCGERRVGYAETKDFRSFTEPLHCLQVDSLDEPLAELYGMPAFEYDNWYIGFPFLYAGQPQKLWWKGAEGTMHCELAYSLNGKHFQRSLREPFLCGWNPKTVEKCGRVNSCLWPSSILRQEDGSILIYASAHGGDHGTLVKGRRMSSIHIYRLRQDGFIRLISQRDRTARLATRENLWRGGEFSVNLKCSEPASVAVYAVAADRAEPLPGFGHGDCSAFIGDSTDWIPQWKGGPLNAHAGKHLIFELCFRAGEVYSFSGNCTPMMYVQARKEERFGMDPERMGW